MGTILYLVGLVCAVLAVLDIFKKNISTVGKVIASVLVLLTSWVGLLVYYFYAKDHLEVWFMLAVRRKMETGRCIAPARFVGKRYPIGFPRATVWRGA